MMPRFLRRLLYCLYWRRRRNRLALFLLLFSGLFLVLLFQLNADIQATSLETLASIQTTSSFDFKTLQRGWDHDGLTSESRVSDREPRSTIKLNYAYSDSKISTKSPRTTIASLRSSCAETQEEPRFRALKEGILLYSAWLDARKSQHFIRVLFLSPTKQPPPLFCHFKSASKQNILTSSSSFYEHNENHSKKFGCFIASCVLPSELNNTRPCFVNISTRSTSNALKESSDTVVLSVGLIRFQHHFDNVSRGQYGICIPPLHGEISVDRLIEFFELSQILGASHFTFYVLSVSDKVRVVLNYYKDKGLASVLSWKFPSYIGQNDIHYFGQTLSIMDCLFRSMGRLNFVAFNDLDEFIVPLEHYNMISLLTKIHHDKHCGHCFESVIFDSSKENVVPNSSAILTQRLIYRTKAATPSRTKCVVNPRRIFEQGIHHISKPFEEYYISDKVDWSVARIFHYRKCNEVSSNPECSAVVEDKTMLRYGERLKRNFNLTETELDNITAE